jgi:uncharacterized Zn-finger protein
MSDICDFCQQKFINKSVLNTHVKTAKYCIKLRNQSDDVKEITNECKYCFKRFSKKSYIKIHENKCRFSKKHIEKLEKDNSEQLKKFDTFKNQNVNMLRNLMDDHKNEIESLKKEKEKLENKVEFLLKMLEDKKTSLQNSENRIQELAMTAIKFNSYYK